MVARCPFAVWKPLPEATSQSLMYEVRGLVYHTPVGTMRGTYDYFARSTVGVESTFLMGCPLCGDELDGVVWQIMDALRRADANLEGNRYFGSVEMCDHGDPSRPLSPKQLASAVRLGLWYRSAFETPGRLCPTPTAPGFGWHAMWLNTSYARADGTTPWSAAPGKVCPGAVRIRQLKTVVFPAVFAGTELGQQGDLSMSEASDIRADIAALRRDLEVYGSTGLADTVEDFAGRQREVLADVESIKAMVGALAIRVDRLVEGVATAPIMLSDGQLAQLTASGRALAATVLQAAANTLSAPAPAPAPAPVPAPEPEPEPAP